MSIREINILNEKRQFVRFCIPLDIFVNKTRNKKNMFCNIGEGGACFESTYAYKLNDFLFLHFSLENKEAIHNGNFSALGRIVWLRRKAKDLILYGTQFEFYNDPFSKQEQEKMYTILEKKWTTTIYSGHY